MAISAQCKEAVSKKIPNRVCTETFCAEAQSTIDMSCHQQNLPAGTPFFSQDPNLFGPGQKGFCYCCCSCFAFGTPIEVAPGDYEAVETVVDGSLVMAAGLSLNWSQRVVASVSSISAPGVQIADMWTVRYSYEGEQAPRQIVLGADDLLLVDDGAGQRTLKVVQRLVAGDRLVRANGGISAVVGAYGGTSAAGVQSIQMGPFDGKNLDGHLLNINGIVAADFDVVIWFAGGSMKQELLHPSSRDDAPHPERTPTSEDEAFLNDPEAWPEGFTPTTRREIRPPANAHAFLTRNQARDVQEKAPTTTRDNTLVALPLLYLFQLARGFFPNTTFLLDWENDVPNAYAWQEWGGEMVLFTGGLVRVQPLDRDGLSLVLADLLAYRDEEVECVGPADFQAVATVMRTMWADDLFGKAIEGALPQIETLFGFVSDEHAGEGRDVCRRPSLDCRLETFVAGLTMAGVPACAQPRPDHFDLLRARAQGRETVVLRFSEPVDVLRAEEVGSYRIDPKADVTGASVREAAEDTVDLQVGGLEPDGRYIVSARQMKSQTGVPIDPRHDSAAFSTPRQ